MDLKEVLRETLLGYAGEGLNGYAYVTSDNTMTRFAVIAIVDDNKPRAFSGIVAHLEDDLVVIYHDANNKPLVDALVQNGVPRDKIILAYAGETIAPST